MSASAMWPFRLDSIGGAVYAIEEIAAPPERVFAALTDPAELAAWWGADGDDDYRTHDWEIDPQEGGQWRARTTDADGNEGTIEGTLLTVEAPRVLEYTWRASWDAETTTVRYELAPATVRGRSGTRLTVRHTGFAALDVRAQAGAWDDTLGRLIEHMTIVCARPTPWHIAA